MKEQQKKLITEIMNEDAKDGLYKQQTAVEQLVQEINKLTGLNIAMDEPCVIQAKQMEKQQVESAYYTGATNFSEHSTKAVRWSKQYYNEEYGENNE